jgi:hypothetical protein
VVVGHHNEDLTISAEIYNLIISEGLRGLTFQNIGKETYICFLGVGNTKFGRIEGNYGCKVKLRSYPRALVNKFPGFRYMTGYKYAKHITSEALLTMKQLKSMLD